MTSMCTCIKKKIYSNSQYYFTFKYCKNFYKNKIENNYTS